MASKQRARLETADDHLRRLGVLASKVYLHVARKLHVHARKCRACARASYAYEFATSLLSSGEDPFPSSVPISPRGPVGHLPCRDDTRPMVSLSETPLVSRVLFAASVAMSHPIDRRIRIYIYIRVSECAFSSLFFRVIGNACKTGISKIKAWRTYVSWRR